MRKGESANGFDMVPGANILNKHFYSRSSYTLRPVFEFKNAEAEHAVWLIIHINAIAPNVTYIFPIDMHRLTKAFCIW